MSIVAAIPESRIHAAIGRLYDAAINPDMLPSAFDHVAEVCGGMGITLFPHDPDETALTYISGAIAEAAAEYLTGWLDRCPRIAYSRRNPIYDRCFWDGEILSKDTISTDPYFRDYAARYDLCLSVIRSTTGLHRSARYIFSSPYSLKAGVPSAEQMRAFEILSGHAVRALQIYRKLDLANPASAALEGLLDQQAHAVVIVNPFGRTVHANRAANALSGRGLSVQNGRLVAATTEGQRALDLLLQQTIWPTGAAPRLTPITLARAPGQRPLLVQAIPLRPTDTGVASGLLRANAGALVLIVDPDKSSPPTSTEALRLIGLTPTEARIAAILGTGVGPEIAAEMLGLSVGTVRNHLKRIFSKFDISRQSQLVELLARLSALSIH
ncbi:MAG: hypothetical protein JWM58_3393 [Rhizobium sp.]|nr:hypothetical protein [Rhizobium sp.]